MTIIAQCLATEAIIMIDSNKREQLMLYINSINLPPLNSNSLHDYASLKNHIIEREFRDEVAALSLMLSDDNIDFEQCFKARCQARSQANRDTCLNPLAMPDGACNKLYQTFVDQLYGPGSADQWWSLFYPGINTYLTYEVVFDTSQPKPYFPARPYPLTCQLVYSPLPALPMNREELAYYVVSGSLILDTRLIAGLPFKGQLSFYQALKTKEPALAKKLYHHNQAFKTLFLDMQYILEKSPPYDVIRQFMHELRLGGQHVTGSEVASLSAQVAYTEFLNYWQSLPTELQSHLLTLTDSTGTITFKTIFDALANSNCVESTAGMIQKLLENPANHSCLQAHPGLNPQYLKAITERYKALGKSMHLDTQGCDNTILLPHYYLEQSFSNFFITDTQELLVLLISFPAEYFNLLFQHAKLPEHHLFLQELNIICSMLDQDKVNALNQAIIYNLRRFGELSQLLRVAIRNKNHQLVAMLFNGIPATTLVDLLNTPDYRHYPPFLALEAYDTPESLLIILNFCQQQGLLATVLNQNTQGQTLLHLAANFPESLQLLLSFYPEEARLAALIKPDDCGNTVLLLCNNDSSSAIILPYYEQSNRSWTDEKNRANWNRLFMRVSNDADPKHVIETYQTMQAAFPGSNILLEKDFTGSTLLHRAVSRSLRMAKTILRLLSEDERQTILIEPNNDNETPIYQAVIHISAKLIMPAVLDSLPISKRFNILTEGEVQRESPLSVAARKQLLVNTVLPHLPIDQHLAVLQHQKNNQQLPALFLSVRMLNCLRSLLQFLAEPIRPDVLTIYDSQGNTILHTIDYFNENIGFLCTSIPQEQVLTALLKKNNHGKNALQCHLSKIRLPNSIAPLLALFAEEVRLSMVLEPFPCNQNESPLQSKSILDISTTKSNLFLSIFNMLSPSQKQTALLANYCASNRLVIQILINSGKHTDAFFKTLFSSLEPQTLSTILEVRDEKKDSLLHYASNDPKLFRHLLLTIPPSQRQSALLSPNDAAETPLDLVIRNAKCREELQLDILQNKLKPYTDTPGFFNHNTIVINKLLAFLDPMRCSSVCFSQNELEALSQEPLCSIFKDWEDQSGLTINDFFPVQQDAPSIIMLHQ